MFNMIERKKAGNVKNFAKFHELCFSEWSGYIAETWSLLA